MYMKFDKKDKHYLWDNNLFYEIKNDEDNDKCIYLILITARVGNDDNYGYKYYKNGINLGKIKDLNEWGDINYEIKKRWRDKIDIENGYNISEPQNVYNMVNNIVDEKSGVCLLTFNQVNEETSCGFYCRGY